jgi:hypothetical protein
MNRELLKQALDALRISAPLGHAMEDYEYRHKVIKDIEAELAKPEMPTKIFGPNLEQILNAAGFYRREWVGLTEVQLSEIYNDLYTQYTRDDVNIADFILIARAIQTKLKELNT